MLLRWPAGGIGVDRSQSIGVVALEDHSHTIDVGETAKCSQRRPDLPRLIAWFSHRLALESRARRILRVNGGVASGRECLSSSSPRLAESGGFVDSAEPGVQTRLGEAATETGWLTLVLRSRRPCMVERALSNWGEAGLSSRRRQRSGKSSIPTTVKLHSECPSVRGVGRVSVLRMSDVRNRVYFVNETNRVPEVLMDVERAAVALRVTPQRVRSLARAGVLTGRQLGRTWLLEVDSVKRHASETGVSVQPSTSIRDDGRLKVMSFFSGAMGLDLGMERAGLETVFASDVDGWCRASIHANRPQMPVIGDVWKYSPTEMLELAGMRQGEVDVIAGGPPCQAFSTAGRRKGVADVRGNVFLRYLDIIREIKPRYFVIENVRGLLSMAVSPGSKHNDEEIPSQYHSHAGVIRYVCAVMESAGYKVSFNLYNAANYGAPQKRERVVILGTRDGERIPHLRPTHAESGQAGLPRWRTFREAVHGLEAHDHLEFPASRLKYYRMLGDGQYWKDLPYSVQREAMGRAYESGGGRTGFFRRVAWDLPSPTLVTSPTMPATDLAHPEELRPLSVQEYGRLQEFPDDWKLVGPIKEQYRQLGNAVPLSLGEAIGRTLVAHNLGEDVEEMSDFSYSRYKNTSDHDLLNRTGLR